MNHSAVEQSTYPNLTTVVHPNMFDERRGSRKSNEPMSVGNNNASPTRTPSTVARKKSYSTDLEKEGLGVPLISRAYDTHGVRFVPAEVLFYNAFRGQCYTTQISIINISTHVIYLSISQPYSSAFHIKDKGTTIKLSPGLNIARKIIFKCSEGKLFDSVIPIRVSHSLILLPIKVIPGQIYVSVEPSYTNFGRIDLGSAFVTKTVQLHNKGSIAAKYAIDLSKNELDIMISPRMGTIKPFGTADIKVQLAGLAVGDHETEFWVKSTPPCRFTVKVTVVVPFLMAIHPFTTEEFTLLHLQPCFPGTYRYETFLVHNASSDKSTVVVLAECDGSVMSPVTAALEDPCFKYFRLSPDDGTLAPFESRVFTLWFAPQVPKHEKGWSQPIKQEKSLQYLCFFRVQRVTVTDPDDTEPIPTLAEEKRCELKLITDENEEARTDTTKESALDTKEKNNIIRICAYSISVFPHLQIVPDELIFENIKVGQQVDKVLRFHNICELPLGISYVKQAHIFIVCPPDLIQPRKSIEVLVQFRPRSLQFEHDRLVFELLSYKNMTDNTKIIPIGQVSVRLSVNIKSETRAPVPKFLSGITPAVNREGEEVGLHTELVLFSPKCADIPAAVMWPKLSASKPWLTSDARVAFPNERRRSLRVTSRDGNVKSIFTGKSRYNVPDDPVNVLTRKEIEFKSKQVAKYRGFISEQAAKKISHFKRLDPEEPKPEEYSIDDERLYALLGSIPPTPAQEFKMKSDDHILDHDVLCPLTPLQLFNIKVKPQIVDFGKMPPRTDCATNIAVDNMNNFPIGVSFRTYKESLTVPGGAFIVPALSTVFTKIVLHLETNGKHYTNMSYVINTVHSYDIKVCADVETRCLQMEPGDLSFRETKERGNLFEVYFLPVKLTNPLGSDSAFKWKIPKGSPFAVVPLFGVVPANGTMTCCVSFNMNSGNQLGTVLILQVEDGIGSHFPVNYIPSNKFTLTLFSPKISCPNISLGVPFVKKIILYNEGRRPSFFSVDDMELPTGIKVFPCSGMVPSRSCFTLSVNVLFREIKKFSFKIPIASATSRSRILVTCNGYVTYPLVKFHPKTFLFQRTPLHSHSSAMFTVTNETSAEVKVKFLMHDYPQFRISSSSDFADMGATLTDGNINLSAEECRSLYLHFEPHDIAGYKFLLPVVINDILGPPVISDVASLSPKTYVTIPSYEISKAFKISGMMAPETLDTITIDVAVQRGYIKCSSFIFEFFKTEAKEKGGHSLTIENIRQNGPVTIRIKTPDQKVGPFSFIMNGEAVENMIPIVLEDKGSIELTVSFLPPTSGTFSTGVPIYVDEFNSERPYTVIKITGIFYRSTLACTSSMVNFIPIHVDEEIDKVIQIIANHQPEETNLTVELKGVQDEPLDDYLTISFPNSNVIPYGIDNFSVPIRIKLRSYHPISLIGFLTAKDGYDGECKITITAIADKSSLTTHAFQFINTLPKFNLGDDSTISSSQRVDVKATKSATQRHSCKPPVSNSAPKLNIAGCTNNYLAELSAESAGFNMTGISEEIEQYPLFPKGTSESEYAKHMRRTKESMEDWIYEQGFQGHYRINIGEMYFYSEQYQSALNSKNKNPHFDDVKSVLDLIIKLTGREFTTQYPLPANVPQDREGRIGHTILVYIAVLNFLMRQGGLIHVSPLYLLDYDDYITYHDKLKPLHLEQSSYFREISQMDFVMPGDVYERLTLQCWLDVFLQLYKILVFYPAMSADPMKSRSTIEPLLTVTFSKSDNSCPRGKPKIQRHLSLQTVSQMLAEAEKSEENLISWINSMFATSRPDCVPPRKINNFSTDLEDGVVLSAITSYFCPFLHELSWAYIYWNPDNKAEETLIFEACLADNVYKSLKLTNPSDHHTIGYYIRKFDENNCFSLSDHKQSIIIKPESSYDFKILFSCKTINKVSATLVLCGTYMPDGYARNLVFVLKGMPAKLQHKLAINITCPLYKVAKVKANINSPFNTDGEFDLILTEAEPRPGMTSKLKPWSVMIRKKMIRPFYTSETSMNIPASMEVPIPFAILAGALHIKTKEYWIIFTNKKIGDFIVKVSIIPDMRAPQHILHTTFPCGHCTAPSDKEPCNAPDCPRVVIIKIPAKNLKLWSAAKAMLSQTLNDVEKSFWDSYLETGLGLKLMSWISQQYHIGQGDMNFMFQTSVTYKVECSNPLITCPPSITIEDVHSDQSVDLPIHVSSSVKPATAVDIKLRADNELRHYQIILKRKVGDKHVVPPDQSKHSSTKEKI